MSNVKASVTTEQITNPEILINNGYSEALAEDVFMLKNRVNGVPVEPLYDKNNNKFIKVLKNVYSYIDPTVDNEEIYHHNIRRSPSFKDL